MRRGDDDLAWRAIRAAGRDDEVRVVLVQDAVAAPPPAGLGNVRLTVLANPEYDQIVESIEWADKVVAW